MTKVIEPRKLIHACNTKQIETKNDKWNWNWIVDVSFNITILYLFHQCNWRWGNLFDL